MKANIKYLILFLLFVLVADQSIGYLSKMSLGSMKSSFFGQINNGINSKSPVFIVGSSRAQNQYNSNLFAEYYGKEAFNAGAGGYGILYSYALIKEKIKKQKPETIIVDVAPNIMVDTKQFEKLSRLHPLIDQYSSFKEIVSVNPTYRSFPFFFQTYKYNSTLFDVFYGLVIKDSNKDSFIPLYGQVNKEKLKASYYDKKALSKYAKSQSDTILNLQLQYLGKIKQLCEQSDIKLYCVISPSFIDYDSKHLMHKIILEHLDLYKIKRIDFTYDKFFLGNETLFKDQLHLNSKGADLFTSMIIDSLKAK